MQRILLFFIPIVIVLGVAASASAQGPTRDAYGGQGDVASEVAENDKGGGGGVAGVNDKGGGGGGVAGVNDKGGGGGGVAGVNQESGVAGANAGTGSPTDAVARPLRGDELPFTGLDVGLVAMGGMLLLALGFGVRRASREPAARPT